MPRNGSGTYSLPQAPFVAGTVISSAAVNSDLSDIASALTDSLPRDGQAGMTGQFKAIDGSSIAPSISFVDEENSGFCRLSAGDIGIVILGNVVGQITANGVQGAAPIGTILDYAGSTAPTYWYLCYGQAISRTTYSALFGIIGTTYGSGDGSTTFNLPDLRGSVVAGLDNMGGSAAGRLTSTYFGSDPTVLGDRGGSQNRTLITANLPAYTPAGIIANTDPGHNHTVSAPFVVNSAGGGAIPAGNVTTQLNSVTSSTNTTGITSAFTGTAQGGSSTAFATIQPALVMNKIIYAGA
jgi:microcystin-dependent protein